ncbi:MULTISPECIES: Mu-like prophage major head subunit gpT family protein [Marinovum]|uniref:Mu-like prophage major head subunit gpT family protein n=1 Tax=Marinovum TaxID=367771 RepID=UPI00065B1418|nr:Mu-like prophage major head subunit gpT family protein [Marinovum sp. PR37]AKO97613.1 Mu-like prophage major head subunit gpT [Marinovum algicola DG 898]MDD9744274.1 Mu-like prophage major head subunit gpT family protein [Marinovum sp. PR37]
MLVNAANLNTLRTGFSTAFQGGLSQASTMHARVSTEVKSTQKEQKYGWLGKIPNVREWIGARAVQNLEQHDYAIKEKPWELTIGVDRDDIETDNLGIYGPMFTEMGMSTGSKWDQLVFALLKTGFTTECYDGQFFFDTDHPVKNEAGEETSVANTDGGSGTPWFLLDVSRAIKPIILQKRKDFEFVAKDKLTDDNVFDNKEFVYGADARGNVGFGFWQFAWGSKQTLSATTYATARSGLSSMKGDYGRPLGIMPNLLVVPPALESAARKILNSENAAGGETNEWKGTAELLVVPWLA